jgi:hypothetical protein
MGFSMSFPYFPPLLSWRTCLVEEDAKLYIAVSGLMS